MKKEQFEAIESFMQSCMEDTVHDSLHIYRVLNYAVQIADTLPEVNIEIVIIAALLHDIGRVEELKNSKICHAEAGSEKAYHFLMESGYGEEAAQHVASCIRTHRYKKNSMPESMEAKIIFDADKLDLTGTVGTARAILFGGQIKEVLYLTNENNMPTAGLPTEEASLFREYNRKLKSLASRFYTVKGVEIGKKQQESMDFYFEHLFAEVNLNYEAGRALLHKYLE